jgi:predicted CoA-substrate-specific enzyme activase
VKHYLGIDAGSSYIKLVLIDSAGKMIGRSITQRGADIDKSCRKGYADLLNECQRDKDQVDGVVATGYGRKQVSFCDEIVNEITALSVGGFNVDKEARSIIDIGGQDSKAISLNSSGKVVDFAMNQKCAAGTGKFLEVTSVSLGVGVDQLGELSLKADKTLSLSSTCTVFAESEIVSHIARGEKKENIIKALHTAISGQVLGLFYQACDVAEGKILFVGGIALNEGMLSELSDRLSNNVIVPEYPQFVGAYGAAIFLKNMKEG